MPKDTYEQHQERMRKLLTPPPPITSLAQRLYGLARLRKPRRYRRQPPEPPVKPVVIRGEKREGIRKEPLPLKEPIPVRKTPFGLKRKERFRPWWRAV